MARVKNLERKQTLFVMLGFIAGGILGSQVRNANEAYEFAKTRFTEEEVSRHDREINGLYVKLFLQRDPKTVASTKAQLKLLKQHRDQLESGNLSFLETLKVAKNAPKHFRPTLPNTRMKVLDTVAGVGFGAIAGAAAFAAASRKRKSAHRPRSHTARR